MSKPKNRGGRPPSPNPRSVHVSVKLTPAEAVALGDIAFEEGVTGSDVLRRAIPRPTTA